MLRTLLLLPLLACGATTDKDSDPVEGAVLSEDSGHRQGAEDTAAVDTGASGSDTGGSTDDSGQDSGAEDSGSGDSDEPGKPTEEICDGQDNDLDGEIDEDDVCASPVLNYDGHAYMFVDTAMAWAVARDACEAMGYHLVQIDDEAENIWVHEQIYPGTDGVGWLSSHTWIGLSDASADWSWVWTDGSTPSYDYWSGEVITDGYGTTHYGQAAAYGDYAWHHWLVSPANWEYRAVCESDGGSR